MHDVERGAGGGGVRDHFLDGRDRHVAYVAVNGHVQLGRQFEDAEDLGVVGARVVLVGQADPEPSGAHLRRDRLVDGFGVLDAGVVRLAEQVGVFEHQFGARALRIQNRRGLFGHVRDPEQTQAPVGHRGPVVDDRGAFPALEEPRDPGDAALQLQRGRDSVHRLVPVGLDRLPVRVEVDESRAHHLPGGVEEHPALLQPVLEHLAGNGHDLVPHHPDVADRVQPGLGVDDPASRDDEVQVTVLGDERRRKQQDKGEEQGAGTARETRRHGSGSPFRDLLHDHLGITGRTTFEGRSASW